MVFLTMIFADKFRLSLKKKNKLDFLFEGGDDLDSGEQLIN